MEGSSCKTINIVDFRKNVCEDRDLGKECQICLFIDHLVNNVERVSSGLEICILDYQDLTKCKGVKDVLCGNFVSISGKGCSDLLVIYRSRQALRCYVVELKLNVKSGKINSDDIDRFNNECGQGNCCSSTAMKKLIIVKNKRIADKWERA